MYIKSEYIAILRVPSKYIYTHTHRFFFITSCWIFNLNVLHQNQQKEKDLEKCFKSNSRFAMNNFFVCT